MKNNGRKVLAALALTLALTPVAFADDGAMHTGAPVAAPAPTADGAMYTDVAPPPPATDGAMYTGATDTLTQVALSLIETLTRL